MRAKKTAMPRGWNRIRKIILERDPICQIGVNQITMNRHPRCTVESTEVDHILPRENGGTEDPSNLRGVCSNCHKHRKHQPTTTREWT